MAGTTITGLSPKNFPILTPVPAKALYTEKEWSYIDAVHKDNENNQGHFLEWNPYPKGTMFSLWGDPMNAPMIHPIGGGLLNKDGIHPNELEPKGELPIYKDSAPDWYIQMNVDYNNPWKCHTCGGDGESSLQQEATYYDGVYNKFNGLACAACKGTGKEAVPMYDLLSENDQKIEYKAHEDHGDF